MKVMIDQNPAISENYAEIHCSARTEEIIWAAGLLKGIDRRLSGKAAGEQRQLIPANIFYFESVDKKTFAYLENSVWEVGITLKEAEELFSDLGFVRINKATVVNLYKIESIRNDFEMRVLVRLENQELLVINRRYKKDFNECLNRIKERLMGGYNETDQ